MGETENYGIEWGFFLALFLPVLGIAVFLMTHSPLLAVAAVLACCALGWLGSESVRVLRPLRKGILVGSATGAILFAAWVVYLFRTTVP